jgi:hypothetical protein
MLAFVANSQTTISGKVSDGVNFLPGASIQSKNSPIAAVTESDGTFKLSGFKTGVYELTISVRVNAALTLKIKVNAKLLRVIAEPRP